MHACEWKTGCAIGCTNCYSKDSTITIYRIPTNPDRRKQWIGAIKRESWNPGSSVCMSDLVLSDCVQCVVVVEAVAHVSLCAALLYWGQGWDIL